MKAGLNGGIKSMGDIMVDANGVLGRPHERGVQPVRRTGAHEYQSLKLK